VRLAAFQAMLLPWPNKKAEIQLSQEKIEISNEVAIVREILRNEGL
jgi:hypothetical protein